MTLLREQGVFASPVGIPIRHGRSVTGFSLPHDGLPSLSPLGVEVSLRWPPNRMALRPHQDRSADDAPERYAQVVRPLMSTLLAVARRILADESQAWDAVQEALLSFWLKGGDVPNPRAWLVHAVSLRSLHHVRSRARRVRNERRASETKPEASLKDEPSRRIEFQDVANALDQAIAEMSPEYREVLLLKSIEHLDYATIAERLRIPVGTVRSRLNRSRQAVRARIAASWNDVSDARGDRSES